MTYNEVRAFLVQKLEIALKRNWTNKADKIAEILLRFNEIAPKRTNPYLPEKEVKNGITRYETN